MLCFNVSAASDLFAKLNASAAATQKAVVATTTVLEQNVEGLS